MSASPILATRNLGLDIGGATIVADVGLEVGEGELLAVIGPNGAGKTTLFNLVSGLHRPTSGSVELDGVDITDQPPFRPCARAGLGRTFQVSSVFPPLSVHENVRLSAEAAIGGTVRIWRRATAVGEAVERATEAIARVGLAGREHGACRAPLARGQGKLSKPWRCRLRPGRACSCSTSRGRGPDRGGPGARELIRSVHGGRQTVLMVEHDMEVVTGARPADRRDAPRAAGRGNAREITSNPAVRRSTSEKSAQRHARWRPPRLPRRVDVSTTSRSIAKAVSGLLGRNGVGKTTTLRALMGLVQRRATIESAASTSTVPTQIAQLGVGYVPQTRRLLGSDGRREPPARGARRRAAVRPRLRPLPLTPRERGSRKAAGYALGRQQQRPRHRPGPLRREPRPLVD